MTPTGDRAFFGRCVAVVPVRGSYRLLLHHALSPSLPLCHMALPEPATSLAGAEMTYLGTCHFSGLGFCSVVKKKNIHKAHKNPNQHPTDPSSPVRTVHICLDMTYWYCI